MAELQRQLTAAVQGFYDSDGVQLALRLIALYVIALWLAAAWWAFRDAERRTGSRIASYFAGTFVILFSPVFFPLALLIYRLVRSPELAADTHDRKLAEAALLADALDEDASCPRCGSDIDPSWVACPVCRLQLARPCPTCGRPASLDWLACAWCGQPLGAGLAAPAAQPAAVTTAARRAAVLAAASAEGQVPVSVDIPADAEAEAEVPAFIAPRPQTRRLRPVSRPQTAAASADGRRAQNRRSA